MSDSQLYPVNLYLNNDASFYLRLCLILPRSCLNSKHTGIPTKNENLFATPETY